MKVLILIILSIFSFNAHSQDQNFWVKKGDFPGLKRERTIAFSIDNKGYVGMGVDTADNVYNDLWEFDVATNSWTQKASLPGSVRRNAIAFSIGTKGFVGTGMDSAVATNGQTLSDFWEYDAAVNLWSQKSDFPGANGTGIYFSTAFVADNKGYVCGGKIGPNNYSDELWEYKPLNDAWILKSTFPGGVRYQLTSFVVDKMAYVGLGVDQNVYTKDLWQYNLANGIWTQKGDFPGGVRGGASAFTLKQRGFITLGGDGGFKKDLWEYNPFSDNWAIRSEFGGSARKNAFVFCIDNYAYVGTGKGVSGKKQSIYQYIPYDVLSTQALIPMNFQVFPIPASGQLNINNHPSGTISIFNLTGNKVYSEKLSENSNSTINLSQLNKGIYLLQFINEKNHTLQSKQIIIN